MRDEFQAKLDAIDQRADLDSNAKRQLKPMRTSWSAYSRGQSDINIKVDREARKAKAKRNASVMSVRDIVLTMVIAIPSVSLGSGGILAATATNVLKFLNHAQGGYHESIMVNSKRGTVCSDPALAYVPEEEISQAPESEIGRSLNMVDGEVTAEQVARLEITAWARLNQRRRCFRCGKILLAPGLFPAITITQPMVEPVLGTPLVPS